MTHFLKVWTAHLSILNASAMLEATQPFERTSGPKARGFAKLSVKMRSEGSVDLQCEDFHMLRGPIFDRDHGNFGSKQPAQITLSNLRRSSARCTVWVPVTPRSWQTKSARPTLESKVMEAGGINIRDYWL